MSDLVVNNMDLWNALVSGKPDVLGPLAELVALDTPLPASNLLRRSLRLAQAPFADLEGSRGALIDKYAAKDEHGVNIPTPDGTGVILTDPQAFADEIEQLMAVEVTLCGAQAVTVASLGNVKFSGRKLDLLAKFVTDDTPPPKPQLVA